MDLNRHSLDLSCDIALRPMNMNSCHDNANDSTIISNLCLYSWVVDANTDRGKARQSCSAGPFARVHLLFGRPNYAGFVQYICRPCKVVTPIRLIFCTSRSPNYAALTFCRYCDSSKVNGISYLLNPLCSKLNDVVMLNFLENICRPFGRFAVTCLYILDIFSIRDQIFYYE